MGLIEILSLSVTLSIFGERSVREGEALVSDELY